MPKRKRTGNQDGVRTRAATAATRASLSKVLNSDVVGLRAWIENAVEATNRLVIVVNRLAKLHILHCLEQGALNFKINDVYMCRLQTILCGGTPKQEAPYDASFAAVRARQQNLPDVKSALPASLRTQLFLYAAQQILTNWKVHQAMRIEQVLRCWWRNHVRAVLPADTSRSDLRTALRQSDTPWTGALAHLEPAHTALWGRYQGYQAACKACMVESVNAAGESTLKIRDHEGILRVWYRMGRENAQVSQAKQLALFPERRVAWGAVRLDARVLQHLVFTFANPARLTQAQIKTDPDLVANTLFSPWARKRVRKNGWNLNSSLVTDGVGCSMQFTKWVPVANPKKFRKGQTQDLGVLYRGTRHAKFVTAEFAELKARLTTAIDPGVASVVTAVSTRGPPLELTQGRYREESKLNWLNATVGRITASVKPLDQALNSVPHRRSPVAACYNEYLQVLWSQWTRRWKVCGSRRWRKAKFLARNARDSLLARTADMLVRGTAKGRVPTDAVVIFGQGGGSGRGFGRLRGGGVKGPVKAIQDRVAKRALVLKADEFRTSKCCRHCHGDLVSGKSYRVRFCPNPTCHAMLHRDIDAAYKIQARTAAVVLRRPLSVFARGTQSWGPWTRHRQVAPFESMASMSTHLQHTTAGSAGSGVVA